MKTTELFEKHFGNTPVVNTDHPNIENFFKEFASMTSGDVVKLIRTNQNFWIVGNTPGNDRMVIEKSN